MKRQRARLGPLLIASVILISGAGLTFLEGRQGEPVMTSHHVSPGPQIACSEAWGGVWLAVDAALLRAEASGVDRLRCRCYG